MLVYSKSKCRYEVREVKDNDRVSGWCMAICGHNGIVQWLMHRYGTDRVTAVNAVRTAPVVD